VRLREISCLRRRAAAARGSYVRADGRSVESFDSTVVAATTDDGRVGWAEVCPLDPATLAADAAGARRDRQGRSGTFGLRSRGARPPPSADGPRARGPSVREVGARRGLPRSRGASPGHNPRDADRRSGWVCRRTPPGDLARRAKPWSGGRPSSERAPTPISNRSRWRAGCRHRKDPRRSPRPRRGGSAGHGLQDGLASARGAARGAGGTRARRRHRTTSIEQPSASLEGGLVVRRACDHPILFDEIVDGAGALLSL